ncbi:methyltransferase [Bacillus sp. E(2018)]|uniref:methyltransferase n=1 Tax=Bacillus sp. E(2018) TaxID=2502239 RepID=UPI0010FA4201|nr:methyltransferase [Bacillus sp. E(2018)]
MTTLENQLEWKLRTMILGGSISQFVTTLVQLGIPDLIGDKKISINEIASTLYISKDKSHRLMKIGKSLEIFKEETPGFYALTDMGELLQSNTLGSLKNYASLKGQTWARQSLSGLLPSLSSNESAFYNIFGQDVFSFLEHNQQSEQYHHSLSDISQYHDHKIVEAYNFEEVNSVTDVGAGLGSLLGNILTHNKHLKGVHFDQRSAVNAAENSAYLRNIKDRCSFITGNFFSEVQTGTDVYILKTILHDWNDEKAGEILSNIRNDINEKGRLLIIEIIMPEHDEVNIKTIMDLEMLIFYGGKERSLSEYNTLLENNGFKFNRVIPTNSDVSIIEAFPFKS